MWRAALSRRREKARLTPLGDMITISEARREIDHFGRTVSAIEAAIACRRRTGCGLAVRPRWRLVCCPLLIRLSAAINPKYASNMRDHDQRAVQREIWRPENGADIGLGSIAALGPDFDRKGWLFLLIPFARGLRRRKMRWALRGGNL